MRRIILSTLLALSIVTTGFAFSPGYYEVTQNLNIRSNKHFGNNLIGYYQKGAVVNVTNVDGDWCKVEHYKFANAYVRCNYLQTTTKNYITPVQLTPSKVEKILQGTPAESITKNIIEYTFSGTRTAIIDVNVRSTPQIGNNRIGYLKQGTSVEITAIRGDWCKVNYKNFSNAYVYCTLLGVGDVEEFFASLYPNVINTQIDTVQPEPSQTTLSPAAKSLENLYHWTMDNDEAGRFYINNSGKIAQEKAKAWQTDAVRAGLRFDFPRELEGYCVHSYISPSDPDNVFQYHCAEPGSEGSSRIVPKNQVPDVAEKTPANFQVPFAAVVGRMIDANGQVWPLLQSYFPDSKKIQMEFVLATDKEGSFWTVKIYDENGKMLKVKVNATDPGALLMVFLGS